jgi:hypothetical protein
MKVVFDMRRAISIAVCLLSALSSQAKAAECAGYLNQKIAPVSVDVVINDVSQTPATRDEFETSDQYNQRVAAAKNKIAESYIVGTVFDPKYAVYDADNQVFVIESYAIKNLNASWEAIFGYGTPLYNKVEFSRSYDNIDIVPSSVETVTGSYKGTNAYGTTIDVIKVKRVVKGIFERAAVAGSGETLFFAPRKWESGQSKVVARISVDPATARTLKGAMKAAVVISPLSPYYGVGKKSWGSPTINNPREIDETVVGVIADIKCALILDGESKVISAIVTR